MSPTIDGTTGCKPTGAVATRGNRRKCDPRRHGHGNGCGAIGGGAVTQLIQPINSPTIDITVGSNGTGMIDAHRDRDKCHPGRHGYRYRDTAVDEAAIAELTKHIVATPTVGNAPRSQGTSCGHARINGGKSHPSRHIDRSRITVRDNCPIAELPKDVVAPTIGDATSANRTVIKCTRIDIRETPPCKGRRYRCFGGGP